MGMGMGMGMAVMKLELLLCEIVVVYNILPERFAI